MKSIFEKGGRRVNQLPETKKSLFLKTIELEKTSDQYKRTDGFDGLVPLVGKTRNASLLLGKFHPFYHAHLWEHLREK